MMNMIKGKLCEKKMFYKKYTWKREWVRPYESLFGIMLNFCKINALNGIHAVKLLRQIFREISCVSEHLNPQEKKKDESFNWSYYDLILPHWYKMRMSDLYSIYNGHQITYAKLYYCPECLKMGYHSFFHQIVNAKNCTFHGVELICDELAGMIKGNEETIIYDTSSLSIKNARNLVHPCLRQKESIVHYTNWLQGKYQKIVHYVSMNDYYYRDIKQELHCPYDFIVKKKYDWHMVVNHCIKGFDELITELLNNESLPNAIRLFNLYEETNEDNKWKCAKFIMTEHNVTDYYLYCKCMNFTRKEQRLDFNERDIDSEDILYEGDISRLKFSFLWSIKDSYYRNSILKTHWILHPFSADNDPSRWIFNGMRLETVKVTGLDNDWVKINNLLASIFIIEDMFEQLWRQYIYLSRKPCGVNVFDGWKDVIIPEYFITQSKTEDGFEIFRLDPIFPGYHWNF